MLTPTYRGSVCGVERGNGLLIQYTVAHLVHSEPNLRAQYALVVISMIRTAFGLVLNIMNEAANACAGPVRETAGLILQKHNEGARAARQSVLPEMIRFMTGVGCLPYHNHSVCHNRR